MKIPSINPAALHSFQTLSFTGVGFSCYFCNQSAAAVAEMFVSASSSPTAVLSISLHIAILCFFSCLVEAVDSSNTTAVFHILSPDFYNNSCPQVENLIASVTAQRFRVSPASGPATLRLFFHDCFVEGCDASILISPGSADEMVERDVEDNKNLAPEGFETISMAKEAVEGNCPGIVSCADILAIAARDFVHLRVEHSQVIKTQKPRQSMNQNQSRRSQDPEFRAHRGELQGVVATSAAARSKRDTGWHMHEYLLRIQMVQINNNDFIKFGSRNQVHQGRAEEQILSIMAAVWHRHDDLQHIQMM